MRFERHTEKLLLIAIIGIIAVLTIFRNFGSEKIEVNKFSSENIEDQYSADELLNTDENLVIHIAGEINNPGIYEFKEGSRLNDAIEKAGGFTDEADIKNVNLAKKLTDEMKVTIPSIHDKNIEQEMEIVAEDSGKIDLNLADKEKLMELPGIGPKTADKIIEYREKNSFKKPEDIKNVTGIGDKMYESIKDMIIVK